MIFFASLIVFLLTFGLAKQIERVSDPVAVTKAVQKPVVEPTDTPIPSVVKKLVIVIDDVGYNMAQLQTFLSIPVPLTFAVLPDLVHTRAAVVAIRSAGKELLLHQPMEPVGQQIPGPGMIAVAMSSVDIMSELSGNIDQIPGLSGVNNHMGSKGTSEDAVLLPLMQTLREEKLFFLDSRTSANSHARRIASETGVIYMERDVFLDNEKSLDAIRKALQDGAAMAEKNGHAIMIGHIWSAELAQVLLEEFGPLLERGYSFDTLASLVLQGKGQWPGEEGSGSRE